MSGSFGEPGPARDSGSLVAGTRVLRERWPVIVLVTLLCLLGVVALSLTATKEYEASSSLLSRESGVTALDRSCRRSPGRSGAQPVHQPPLGAVHGGRRSRRREARGTRSRRVGPARQGLRRGRTRRGPHHDHGIGPRSGARRAHCEPLRRGVRRLPARGRPGPRRRGRAAVAQAAGGRSRRRDRRAQAAGAVLAEGHRRPCGDHRRRRDRRSRRSTDQRRIPEAQARRGARPDPRARGGARDRLPDRSLRSPRQERSRTSRRCTAFARWPRSPIARAIRPASASGRRRWSRFGSCATGSRSSRPPRRSRWCSSPAPCPPRGSRQPPPAWPAPPRWRARTSC